MVGLLISCFNVTVSNLSFINFKSNGMVLPRCSRIPTSGDLVDWARELTVKVKKRINVKTNFFFIGYSLVLSILNVSEKTAIIIALPINPVSFRSSIKEVCTNLGSVLNNPGI